MFFASPKYSSSENYTSVEHGFSINMPYGWELTKPSHPLNTGGDIVAYDSDGSNINIAVGSVDFENIYEINEDYVNAVANMMRSENPDYHVLKTGYINLGQHKMHYIKAKYSITGNFGTHQLIHLLMSYINKGKLYAFTFAANEKRYPFVKNTAFKSISTFRLSGESEKKYSGYNIKSDGCEYTITYPAKPEISSYASQGYGGIRYSLHNDSLPIFGSECYSADTSQFPHEDINYILKTMASNAGARMVNKNIIQTKLGTVGELKAIKETGKNHLSLIGRIYIGNKSLLFITIVDYSDNIDYRIKNQRFLDSVRR